jgi:hypothetical protein
MIVRVDDRDIESRTQVNLSTIVKQLQQAQPKYSYQMEFQEKTCRGLWD